jgi:hypothetical protein
MHATLKTIDTFLLYAVLYLIPCCEQLFPNGYAHSLYDINDITGKRADSMIYPEDRKCFSI